MDEEIKVLVFELLVSCAAMPHPCHFTIIIDIFLGVYHWPTICGEI